MEAKAGRSNPLNEKLQTPRKSLTGRLGQGVNNLSIFHKRLSLILFGLIVGMVLLAQIIRAISEENAKTFSIERVTVPKDIHRYYKGKDGHEEFIRVKRLLDSIKGTPVYDSLMIARPGLVDSVNSIVQHYQSLF